MYIWVWLDSKLTASEVASPGQRNKSKLDDTGQKYVYINK